ncbi:MAG: ATP phosphoribosyltransferase regulatory subunit [Gammaproteobacteria bacterium]
MNNKVADQWSDKWLLPEGVEEVLPPHAECLEQLRRGIIDLFQSWGYELVIPPLMEYLESLLTGSGHDLDLQTFKITDQRTGRLMGVRADMTPQIARIDAHRLKNNSPNRLCYLGPVLQTNPKGLSASRNPLQIGAELFGHDGLESDVEIICLMLAVLKKAGLESVYMDIGHIKIFNGLVKQAGLSQDQEHQLFDILQRKAVPELKECLSGWNLSADASAMLEALVDLNGGREVLEIAKDTLSKADQDVQQALCDLIVIVDQVLLRVPDLKLNIDLSELRGFHYHTGVMFAAYLPGHGQAIARGGRYDEIGEVFGRARPATGFSTDLKSLIHTGTLECDQKETIHAPWSGDPDLAGAVHKLREEGCRVVNQLPGHNENDSANKTLVKENNNWIVK